MKFKDFEKRFYDIYWMLMSVTCLVLIAGFAWVAFKGLS